MVETTPNDNLPTPPPDGWELVCAGILWTRFGRRPSRALVRAMTQLAAEEALAEDAPEPAWLERVRECWLRWRPLPRFAFAAGLLLVIGIAVWSLWPSLAPRFGTPAVPICTLAQELDAQWAAGSPHPKVGEPLTVGTLQLKSGVVELDFTSKARVAVEGPALVTLNGYNTLKLEAGKMSADVQPSARGFSVQTPNATVVDLGTDFGVAVAADHSAQLAVFKGRVKLTTTARAGMEWLLTNSMAVAVGANGDVTTTLFSETLFPQVSDLIATRPSNCGFNVLNEMALGGMPLTFSNWSGPAYELTGPTQGIGPFEGAGMLRFLAPPGGGDSVVWQLIDLRPFKAQLASGDAQIRASVLFNRVRGNAGSANEFALTVAAYAGEPVDTAQLWARRKEVALAVAEKVIATDNDPATWEKAAVATPLPASADFMIVGLRAIHPATAAAGADPFPGHFADFVDCSIYVPIRASLSPINR